jgi:hypothetical protein
VDFLCKGTPEQQARSSSNIKLKHVPPRINKFKHMRKPRRLPLTVVPMPNLSFSLMPIIRLQQQAAQKQQQARTQQRYTAMQYQYQVQQQERNQRSKTAKWNANGNGPPPVFMVRHLGLSLGHEYRSNSINANSKPQRKPSLVVLTAVTPCALTDLVNTANGLYTSQICVGITGTSFVKCDYCTSSLFIKEISGTVNSLVDGT